MSSYRFPDGVDFMGGAGTAAATKSRGRGPLRCRGRVEPEVSNLAEQYPAWEHRRTSPRKTGEGHRLTMSRAHRR